MLTDNSWWRYNCLLGIFNNLNIYNVYQQKEWWWCWRWRWWQQWWWWFYYCPLAIFDIFNWHLIAKGMGCWSCIVCILFSRHQGIPHSNGHDDIFFIGQWKKWPWWYWIYWWGGIVIIIWQLSVNFAKTFEFCRMLNNFHKKSFIGKCFVFLGIFLWDHISHRNIERQYWQYSVVAVREVQKSKIILCLRWWNSHAFLRLRGWNGFACL